MSAAAAAAEGAHEGAGEITNYNILEIYEMKFEDFRYVERIDKYGKTPCLIMPGGFSVFKSTMELAWACVHQNWASIDWTKKQSAETLISSAVWQTQVKGAKLALGRCIMFFVTHDLLPLPLGLAVTRRGKPYRGGKRLYVPAQTSDAEALPVLQFPASRTARNRELLAHVDWAALGKQPLQLQQESHCHDC